MGYHTEFRGSFKIDPPLTADQLAYVRCFCSLRHMPLRVGLVRKLRIPDPLRKRVGLPLGKLGCFFTGIVDEGYNERAGGVAEYLAVADEKQLQTLMEAARNPTDHNTKMYWRWLTQKREDKRPTNEDVLAALLEGKIPFPIYEDHNEDLRELGLSYYCSWAVNDAGDRLEWSGAEKFYRYAEWLDFMIKNFFKPWGRLLTGKITWKGEEKSDRGTIVVTADAAEKHRKPSRKE